MEVVPTTLDIPVTVTARTVEFQTAVTTRETLVAHSRVGCNRAVLNGRGRPDKNADVSETDLTDFRDHERLTAQAKARFKAHEFRADVRDFDKDGKEKERRRLNWSTLMSLTSTADSTQSRDSTDRATSLTTSPHKAPSPRLLRLNNLQGLTDSKICQQGGRPNLQIRARHTVVERPSLRYWFDLEANLLFR